MNVVFHLYFPPNVKEERFPRTCRESPRKSWRKFRSLQQTQSYFHNEVTFSIIIIEVKHVLSKPKKLKKNNEGI